MWVKQDMPAKGIHYGDDLFRLVYVGADCGAGGGPVFRASLAGNTMQEWRSDLLSQQTYRYVLLPMAFRIIIPPLTSEFMSVFKNSSGCIRN